MHEPFWCCGGRDRNVGIVVTRSAFEKVWSVHGHCVRFHLHASLGILDVYTQCVSKLAALAIGVDPCPRVATRSVLIA